MKYCNGFFILMLPCLLNAQYKKRNTISLEKIDKIDSVFRVVHFDQRNAISPIPIIDENNLKDLDEATSPVVLGASRDPFKSAAAFQFSAMRFQVKGFSSSFSQVTLNGLLMQDPASGAGLWSSWSGLNEIFRINESSNNLQQNSFWVAAIGESSNIDIRASKQRPQRSFGYALSNRSYSQRFTLISSTGMRKNGWAFSVNISARLTNSSPVPGTFNDGLSYFVGADKKIGSKQLLSFSFFGVTSSSGKQSAILKESKLLLAEEHYNPNWGFQNGAVRNASISSQHLPVLLLTHELRLSSQNFIQTSLSLSNGIRSSTGLDWYHAPDPRPDYYRYLPSYQTDPFIKEQVALALQKDINLQQINWNRFYEVNRSSVEKIYNANGIVGNTIRGNRARYIVENRLNHTTRFNAASSYHGRLGDNVLFSTGFTFQLQKSNYYKTVNDLLGADFYVNWNQFAESDFPNDPQAIQNDLVIQNRILKVGDKFGYDYTMVHQREAGWVQAAVNYKKVNFYLAAEISLTKFRRIGNTTNGLFPNNSYGRSDVNSFLNNGIKLGANYLIDGHQSLYLSAAFSTKPPSYDNVFISPRTRDTRQENVMSESYLSSESGYVLQTNFLKCRLSAYYLLMKNGMDILSFYHDGYNSFVNYAISGIGQVHIGGEMGLDLKMSPAFSFQAAAAIGNNYFNTRQLAVVTSDNTTSEIERVLIYAKNFKVGNAPQDAYSLGLNYRSSSQWFLSLNANLFDKQYLGWNPIRRTAEAIFPLDPISEKGQQLLQQERLPTQYLMNVFLSHRFPMGKRRLGQWEWNLGVNNLFDKKDVVVSGYEQLRFDFDSKIASKFPPKYLYGQGINFLISMMFRIN